jgi:hypothetical protein
MRNALLARLPPDTRLTIATERGPLLDTDGEVTRRLSFPKGTATVFARLAKGYIVNKKGKITKLKTLDLKWQEDVLARYEDLSRYFMKTFGYALFINYGTLLGFMRNGDFVPHDDDFDTGYLSRHTTPEDVKAEMKSIITRMAKDGYSFRIPNGGGLFQHVSQNRRLDITPAWISDGRLWMNSTTSIRTDGSLIAPVGTAEFKGRAVFIPRDPLAFVRKKYGRKWRIPDTGYSPTAASGVIGYLSRSRLTRQDFDEIEAEIRTFNAGTIRWA